MSFTKTKLGLIVSICGGVLLVPNRDQKEMILKDVVISKSIFEYDNRKQYPDSF